MRRKDREITDPEEKKAGLTAILRQSTGQDPVDIRPGHAGRGVCLPAGRGDAGLQGASLSIKRGAKHGKEERTYADFSGD